MDEQGSRKALVEFAACWCAVSGAHERQNGERRRKNAIAGHAFASWEAFEAHLAKCERESATCARRSRCLADERTAAYCTMSVKPLPLRQFDRWRAFGGFDQLHKGEPSTFMGLTANSDTARTLSKAAAVATMSQLTDQGMPRGC